MFELGEIVTIVPLSGRPEYSGQDAEIIGGLEDRLGKDPVFPKGRPVKAYRIRVCSDDKVFISEPKWLRKKPKGKEETVPWSSVVWQPIEVRDEQKA